MTEEWTGSASQQLDFMKAAYARQERRAYERNRELHAARDDRDRYHQALVYLVERCDREFTNQNRPPELDFVMLAVGEVREKVLGDSPAGLDHVPLRDVVKALRAVDPPAGDSPHLWLAAHIEQRFGGGE